MTVRHENSGETSEMPEDMGDLVEQIGHLTNVKAAVAPEAAKRKPDTLIFTFGRAAVGAALVMVAPA
ncbi:hypothetical protein [Parasphingorhabdus pacifica]